MSRSQQLMQIHLVLVDLTQPWNFIKSPWRWSIWPITHLLSIIKSLKVIESDRIPFHHNTHPEIKLKRCNLFPAFLATAIHKIQEGLIKLQQKASVQLFLENCSMGRIIKCPKGGNKSWKQTVHRLKQSLSSFVAADDTEWGIKLKWKPNVAYLR